MTCIITDCDCEGRERADWPMAESPAAFFTMFDGFDADLFDIELELERRSGIYGRDEVAELVGLSRSSLSQWIKRRHLPAPDHYDDEDRAIWTAKQLAPVIARRRREAMASLDQASTQEG